MNHNSTSFVDLDNARQDDQRQVMQAIIAAGHCPFCLENLRKYHRQPILKETSHWLLTKNQWPYDHTQLHLLVCDHATSYLVTYKRDSAHMANTF